MCQRLPLRCGWQYAILLFPILTPWVVFAQTDVVETPPLAVVDFQRDIAPLLATRCLECHGANDAKNDFRVDEKEQLLDLIEPGDANASLLWTDYLRSADSEMQMPPASQGGSLPSSELALFSVWISEGANWPDGAVVALPTAIVAAVPDTAPDVAPASLLSRVWAFQGFFHPATVHFPVALLLVGGLFVVVSFKYPELGQNVALVCLFLGTISAIAASMMGWSFAARQGYGRWDRFDLDSEIFWHRWSALIVTFMAIATSLFALAWLRNGNLKLAKYWKVGLLAIAAMVGAVGHQGGELTYGKAHYQDAFNALFGNDAKTNDAKANAMKANAMKTSEPKTTPQ